MSTTVIVIMMAMIVIVILGLVVTVKNISTVWLTVLVSLLLRVVFLHASELQEMIMIVVTKNIKM